MDIKEKINYNDLQNKILQNIEKNEIKPNLFLHVCCGPCSTYVLYKLKKYFNIYAIFHNSNIDTEEEFNKRFINFQKVVDLSKTSENVIKIIFNDYNHNEYLREVYGLENEREGGARCEKCIRYRLKSSFLIAKKYIYENNLHNNNYLCSTLSISPHKNAKFIEETIEELCKDDDTINALPSDFKKENGYLMSIKLSHEYGIYRQDYCGCEFAKAKLH